MKSIEEIKQSRINEIKENIEYLKESDMPIKQELIDALDLHLQNIDEVVQMDIARDVIQMMDIYSKGSSSDVVSHSSNVIKMTEADIQTFFLQHSPNDVKVSSVQDEILGSIASCYGVKYPSIQETEKLEFMYNNANSRSDSDFNDLIDLEEMIQLNKVALGYGMSQGTFGIYGMFAADVRARANARRDDWNSQQDMNLNQTSKSL